MKKKFVLGIVILMFLTIIIVYGRHTSNFSFEFKSDKLSKIINDNLPASPTGGPADNGQYAVYIEDLLDEESYSLRSLDSFPAASLYKLFLLAATLKEIEEGRLKLEDGLSVNKMNLVDTLGEDEFGIDDLPDQVEFTVEEAMIRIGRISDNFAAIMLGNKIGWDKVQSLALELGAKNTSIQDPIQTSAEDIALFFKKLYRREIVSIKISEEVEKYLSLNQLNNRIPAGVPDGVRVIHKTGELSGVRHDGGIVYLTNSTDERSSSSNKSNRSYIIVLMSKDLKYEDEGVETLARISKAVYDYFQDKSNLTN